MKNTFAIVVSALVLWAACNTRQTPEAATKPAISFVDTLPGSCPYLTKDNRGNAVLSWVRETNDSDAVFCYAVSADGGRTFGKAIVISSSFNVHPHSENIPKILFKPSGEIIAAWGTSSPGAKNKYAGRVYYAQSFDGGKKWSEAKPLVTDSTGFDQRYFDMALLPNGEAAITWLDNRKTIAKEGSALYFATTSGGAGFEQERRIQQPCCQCCRTDLYVDKKANIHILYRGIINDSIRDMVHTVSEDGGRTFDAAQRISNDNWVINACPHTGPSMAENERGLHFAWYTGGRHKGSFYTHSASSSKTYEARDSISQRGSHPQLSALSNGELLVVWDETFPVAGKLFSRIGIQKRSPEGKTLESAYIAADSLRVTYPVVAETKNRHVLIAFCQQKKNKSYVAYYYK
jgi:hypothetical protein